MMNVIIIAATVLVSIPALDNFALKEELKHWPYAEFRRKEYYRWITGGLVHADWGHLLFNMLTLYFFGRLVEGWFQDMMGTAYGSVLYLLFYLLALAASSSATYYHHRNHAWFSSIGASGAVAAILFAAILLKPTMSIYIMFIPIGIPGFIFGPLYLWYSADASKRNRDNIDHLAHFYGAVFGFLLPMVFNPGLFIQFLQEMFGYLGRFFG